MTSHEIQELAIKQLLNAYLQHIGRSSSYWVKPSVLRAYIEPKYAHLLPQVGIAAKSYICQVAFARFKQWLKSAGYTWDKRSRCWMQRPSTLERSE